MYWRIEITEELGLVGNHAERKKGISGGGVANGKIPEQDWRGDDSVGCSLAPLLPESLDKPERKNHTVSTHLRHLLE